MKEAVILLIEDNPDDEMLTIRAFEKANYHKSLVIARDGVEALELLFDAGSKKIRTIRPDLILLDLKLPKVDGKEVLKRIRENPQTRFIPVVVLTSSIEESDVESCYILGGNSYVRKPIDFEQFKQVIETLCDYWLNLNHAVAQSKSAEKVSC